MIELTLLILLLLFFTYTWLQGAVNKAYNNEVNYEEIKKRLNEDFEKLEEE